MLQLLLKELKKDLKPLSGASKSQVGEFVVAVDKKKKVVRGLGAITWS